jgi:monoamine oxidase
VETAEVSTVDLARYADSTHNWAVQEGLGTVVAHAADGLDVKLQAAVTHIDWSAREVRVESTAGSLTAHAAIVTVPTTVLARGAIRFTPALPPAWRDAAENLPLGVANKVFFRLAPGAFEAGDARHFIGRADTSRTCSYLLFPARQPLLCTYFGGDLSKELEARGQLEHFAREELRGIFGAQFSAGLGAARCTGWGTDPNSLGSYSAARPGHADARAMLAQPVSTNLCMAGEACSVEYYGTLHGAWLSGQAAAEALLRPRPGSP